MHLLFIHINFRVSSIWDIWISYPVLSVLAGVARSGGLSDKMLCLSSFNVFINFHFSEPSPVVSPTVKKWALSDTFLKQTKKKKMEVVNKGWIRTSEFLSKGICLNFVLFILMQCNHCAKYHAALSFPLFLFCYILWTLFFLCSCF